MLKSKFDQSTAFERRFEKVRTIHYPSSLEASKEVAREIADLIKSKQSQNQYCVLGLATGATPKSLYQELVDWHKNKKLSFKNVITFNLDEYYPMSPDSIQSYVHYMNQWLFKHIDILPENCHLPKGDLDKKDITSFCERYEKKIEKLGGLDLQVLGIGLNGHIGFNESGSLSNSKTRLVALDHVTRVLASVGFQGLSNTPKTAITLGIQKIMEAKRVILMAWGDNKSSIIKKAVEEPMTSQVPASYLQEHPDATLVLDRGAASQLTRIDKPWLTEKVEWNDALVKKAVVRLSTKMDKAVLMLTEADYIENGMNELLIQEGSAYNINMRIFNQLQQSLTEWPGGKAGDKSTTIPERAHPKRKRIIVFSPHPDDDIISMGGTLRKLHQQGHEVHVAYQVSGNIAVADDEAVRFIDFMNEYMSGITYPDFDLTKLKTLLHKLKTMIHHKKTSEVEPWELRKIKGSIRKSEARSSTQFIGIPDEHVHFLDMPFYETGTVNKHSLGNQDIDIIVTLIEKVKPHQIYAAGDFADPNGTHKTCFDAILKALHKLKGTRFLKDCWLWLYRGAWQEWDITEIEMAVPMNPKEVLEKRQGIFKHQSQKDEIMFPGNDSREFWQRAEQRNKETADLYYKLGLARYAAIEAFARYHY